ncbi:MAG TPA: ZIP family metal transporter, partial [Stenomitos sp.]
MTHVLLDATFYSLLAALGLMLGAFMIVKGEGWLKAFLPLAISFAAGTLLGVAFFDLLPEAQEMAAGANIFPWVLGSFIGFYFLENLLHYHSHHHVGHHHPMGLIAFLGMGFHSLIDGITIGVGFEVSRALGLVTTLGLLAHQIPSGIAITSILLHAGHPKRKAFTQAGLVALATPVGAIATSLLLRGVTEQTVGLLLAVASGSFLYVAASDLIPESHAAKHALTGVLLLAGVVVIWG